MKKRNLFLLGVLFLFFPLYFMSCSDKDDDNYHMETQITYKDLPISIQNILTQHYDISEISKVDIIYSDGVMLYQISFNDGGEIVFNEKAEWQEIDAPDGMTVPSGLVPADILNYVNTNYPDYGINEINKTGYGYNVELVTGLDLRFNFMGEFLGFDD